jgi:hypothetical protein
MTLAPFLAHYPPTDTRPMPQAVIDHYKDIVPASLTELWQQHGYGKYGDGVIEMVNPEDYEDGLATWLGKRAENYVPIAINAFSELFYYRRLTEDDEDVCVVDTHYSRIDCLTWSLDEFFNEYLLDEEKGGDALQKKLFAQALRKVGPLPIGDVYMIAPAVPIGGALEIDYVQDKGNAPVHLQILFQMRG